MAYSIKKVESSDLGTYEEDVDKLLNEGYTIKVTNIGKRKVGTQDEYSIYQAALIKELD